MPELPIGESLPRARPSRADHQREECRQHRPNRRGNTRPRCTAARRGNPYRTVLLAHGDHRCAAWQPAFDEEIFGPVAAITTFADDDEAVELANRTNYGLVSAVASPDLARKQRVAERLRAGVVHINDQTVLHEVHGPIGGTGDSGNGFNHSTLTNADQFSAWQWVTTRNQIPT
jgi:acyl-CoA reductase-like NAD-dependent aldehyde dehydrogenase